MRNKTRNYASRNIKRHHINEVDETGSASDEEFNQKDELIDQEGIEEVNFPYSKFTEEEDLAYYNND